MSKLESTIRFCGLFEAELLVDLMLRYWEHPCAGDEEVANYLLEAAAEVLMRSKDGSVFLEGNKPRRHELCRSRMICRVLSC